MKNIKEKKTILKLYDENLNDIIWTHKIQAGSLDDLAKKYKKYRIIKESIVGFSGFSSAICIYFDEIIGALIVNALSMLVIIFDSIFKFCSYEEKIKNTNTNVNDLWFMKKDLTMYKEYLRNDMITWMEAKEKLEKSLKFRKEIYSKLESVPNNIVDEASNKLINRKDEKINQEFFDDNEG